MTSRHYRAACAVTAALIVATLGAILGHYVAPAWWTLTAAVVCGAVVAVWGAAGEQRLRDQAERNQPVLDYRVVVRAKVPGAIRFHRHTEHIYGTTGVVA